MGIPIIKVDKMVLQPFYLYNGNVYNGTMILGWWYLCIDMGLWFSRHVYAKPDHSELILTELQLAQL